MKLSSDSKDQRIKDGCKVRINMEKIINYDMFDSLLPDYKEFVKNSKGKVFIARTSGDGLASLDGVPRWLFWVGDLELV